MPTLNAKGALLDIELRKGDDLSFTIRTRTFDMTGGSAVMNIDYDAAVQHAIELDVSAFLIDGVIPHDVTSVLPVYSLKSRHRIIFTDADGLVRTLAYGTLTCLDEPA